MDFDRSVSIQWRVSADGGAPGAVARADRLRLATTAPLSGLGSIWTFPS